MSRVARFFAIYFAVLLSPLDRINAANIIAFFPLDFKSSAIFSEAIVKTLVAAGHDVTYVTAIPPSDHLTNCTVIDFQIDSTREITVHPTSHFRYGWFSFIRKAAAIQKEKYCFSEGVKKSLGQLKTLGKKFDLLFIPLTAFPKCFLPIAQEFGIPYVGVNILRSLMYADTLVANPRNPAFIPFDYCSFHEKFSFWNRFWNTIGYISEAYILKEYDDVLYDWRFKKHFPNFDINQVPKMALLFNNNHHSILPRPMSPNAIDVGGLQISKTVRVLPQPIKTFLDEGENGVILFSLGTLVRNAVLDSEKRRILLNVFARISERVLWKFSENLPNVPTNVLIKKWLPQRDILAHKNVKVFLTHGGFLGTQEAIYEGKPLIIMPLNIDQHGNAALMYKKGVGKYLEISTLTEEKLFEAIRSVIDDEKYRENMENLSAAYKDRPMTPEKTLIYWTEHVLRHKGATHLQIAAVDMPFYQYFLLDVILFLLIISLTLFWVSYFIFKRFYQLFFKKSEWLKQTDLKKQN